MPMRTMARHFGVSLSVIQRRKLRWKITDEQRSILEWVEKELNDR
jgi:Zn-dependent peptidase ImmA (M78 family)